ncbi:SHOCT-like domain-containing protein [Neobacillus sp. D3-1R]|uniref:SHOCT-like domain-containing protein n=1 Tax=Neobacillus sp. D3-1R TaxID=3445778 RepID=UPI003FA1879E
MNVEIEKVLTMVQEGKIDSQKASELIDVLKAKQERSGLPSKGSNYVEKTLKIRVVSEENDRVSVNLPIKLVKVVLLAGHSIASSIPQSEKYVKDIKKEDIDLILKAIENEIDGQIIEVNSANGDIVTVSIE